MYVSINPMIAHSVIMPIGCCVSRESVTSFGHASEKCHYAMHYFMLLNSTGLFYVSNFYDNISVLGVMCFLVTPPLGVYEGSVITSYS